MLQADTPLERVKGIGPKTAAAFSAAGLNTIQDAIYFFPYKYEDYSQIGRVIDVRPGNVSLKCHIEAVTTRRVRRGMHITEAVAADQSGRISVIWFNQPYRADHLRKNPKQVWLLTGEYGLQGRKYQIVNPSLEIYRSPQTNTSRIIPIYPAKAGLKSHLVRKLMQELKPFITMQSDPLPSQLVNNKKIISHSQALIALHFPRSSQAITAARARLGFEELLYLMLASKLNKNVNLKLRAQYIAFEQQHAQQFVRKLPFKLTNAQRLVIWQIIKDFQAMHPMNRLLQGDVGSGKTVVATMSASIAAQAGFQTAFMAPTEILARQHAATIEALVKPFGLNVALLTSAVKGRARQLLYQAVASGTIDILVGTHALIQDGVLFQKLGFVVIDEQHRFGVQQRQKLLQKATRMPHVLLMTATPIPRSLALTIYGELDISVLAEKPKNRQAIKTRIISPNSRQSMYSHVDHQITAGRQVYVVCPVIDDKPESEKISVEAEYKKLQQTIFAHRRIGLLHGQMKADEKQQIMQKFMNHELDILVSTTVIEVGVDVSNATIMIIENADQFGLAQVHQLRGRVGRGEHQSYCYLVSSNSLKPTKRMQELERSDDGFYLAEMDLAMRGPGEIYGKAQHGQLNLQFASLSDSRSLAYAQKIADKFIQQKYDLLQYPHMKKIVEQYQRITTLN